MLEFKALLASGADHKKLQEIAHEVRQSKIRMLKSRVAMFSPDGTKLNEISRLQNEIVHWEELPIEQVIEMCHRDRV